MHEAANSTVENGAAVETAWGAAGAHPDDIAARERDDAACHCGCDGGFAEHHQPRAHGFRPRRDQGAQAEAEWRRQRENMTLAAEKALLECFAEAAGAGEMLNIHDLKAAYEQAIGHATSNSTIYNLLARHGWRKLMPRPFHPKRDIAAQEAFKKTAFQML